MAPPTPDDQPERQAQEAHRAHVEAEDAARLPGEAGDLVGVVAQEERGGEGRVAVADERLDGRGEGDEPEGGACG